MHRRVWRTYCKRYPRAKPAGADFPQGKEGRRKIPTRARFPGPRVIFCPVLHEAGGGRGPARGGNRQLKRSITREGNSCPLW